MRRLPFRIPEFSPRITWTSAAARAVWEPRLSLVSAAFVEAERQSVIVGLRDSTLQTVAPEGLTDLAKAMAAHGLVVLPVGKVARSLAYASASQPVRLGEPFDLRVVITRPAHLDAWAKAWETSDNETIGRLLGYPACCRTFFSRVWDQEHWFDTTGPMAEGYVHVRGTNMLLRWFGVRPVPHLPCAFDCLPTLHIATKLRELMPEPAQTWARQMLSWPVKWSSLHGIAEIFTPVFRAIVPTDALASKTEVCFQGDGYPKEGATGLSFPYRREGMGWEPRNGFMSDEAMFAAHAVLLQALPNRSFETVIDLGCGDGALLRQIAARRRVGVESNILIHPYGLDRTVYQDCQNAGLLDRLFKEEHPDLVIAQRQRNPPELLTCDCDILSYSYEGTTTAECIRRRVPA